MSGMDFLKSCITNVRVVEDVFQTQYNLYLPLNASANRNELHHAVADLRKHNVLCAAVNEELWVFGPSSEKAELQQLLDAQKCIFILEDSETVSRDPARKAGDGRPIKDVSLDAIEASISFTLAQEKGMLHVGSWQWAFCTVDEEKKDGASMLVKLHANLTDYGTLFLSTTIHACSLRPIREAGGSQDVVLAPSGRLAKLVVDREHDNTEAGQRQKPVIGSEAWRRTTVEILAAEGIYINSDDEWVTVELCEADESHRALWPARLCLTSGPHIPVKGELDWKYWFTTASPNEDHETYKNPLAAAEEWFMNSTERANKMQDETASALGNTLTTTSMVVESPLATSPPFNQRTIDHQAAMSGIYPTPPDGLMPAHMVAQHSTSDDALRAEHSNETTQFLGSDDTQQNFQGSQSLASSTEPQAYQPNSLAVDDLFGDMDGMDEFDPLGANEVGDADFDYFDEPDDIDTGAVEVEKDVEMVGDAGPVEDVAVQQERDAVYPLESLGDEAPVAEAVDISEPLPDMDARMEHDDKQTGVFTTSLEGNEAISDEPEKPLSPFRIRERLLPPPIPASANNQQPTNQLRRSSTFDPIIFNEGLDNLSAKYIATRYAVQNAAYIELGMDKNESKNANISLPYKRKKRRMRKEHDRTDSGVDPMETSQSSEEDSYEDTTSMSESEDEALPPRLPWVTKKRKRDSLALESFTQLDERLSVELVGGEMEKSVSEEIVMRLSETLTSYKAGNESSNSWRRVSSSPWAHVHNDVPNTDSDALPSIEELHELTKLDLVYVAQIISEQAVTATKSLVASIQDLGQSEQDEQSSIASTVQALAKSAIDHVLSNTEDCSIGRLALIKEPLPRTPTNSSNTHSQMPRPRPPHTREVSMQLGPDYFPIPPQYVHVHRGAETWEMLPPALSFWSALGLGPANGAKDIRAICVIPESEDLAGLVRDFMGELGRAYEGCKLGSFGIAGPAMAEIGKEMEEFDDGMVAVKPDSTPTLDVTTVLREYATLCTQLGKALAKIGHADPDRTVVVCIVNPFEECAMEQQHLCVCFWLLYKAYRDNTPKAHRNVPRSDLVLQILPISLIASTHGMAMLDAQQMGILATELYDRCPPSAKAAFDSSSTLSILAAPAVELASLPPKRIGFQLSADPPGDLLHEGSILHLAYAVSRDGEWMTVCWVDSTGRYQRTTSACLRGKSFKVVAVEIWEQTMEIIAARKVMWRVFIVASQTIDESLRKCWRSVVGTKPRKQMLHVTLLTVEKDPALQLSPSSLSDGVRPANSVTHPGGGFLTPASTPQATTFTVSPDASGQNNAPPTPGPSDTAANIVESDPDAHLLDLKDESWAMLLAPPFTSGPASASEETSASGLLFRRGDGYNWHLETLGVDLHWDIRVQPNGLVDDGPQRQVEANLREVLKMYRSLSLLARARGIDRRGCKNKSGNDERRSELLPVHVLSAVKGAEALDGLLR